MSDKPIPILYNYFRSSASWRVRILLEYKGIEYEYKAVNLLKQENTTEDYLKICPMGQVPALLWGNGKIITQSMAILEFLEEMYPQKPMMPKNDIFKKVKILEICDIVNSGIQPLQNSSVIMKFNPENLEKRLQWAEFWIKKGFTALEIILKDSSGQYCVGDEITWADACFYPQAASAIRFNVEIEDYPTLNKVYKNLKELEPFKKAHAFVQPDCTPELRIPQ